MPLASLVKPREAALFEELACAVADLSSDAHQAQRDNEPLMESIRSAITEAIKSEVKLQLAGSIKKGTYTRSSDLDIVVDTPGRCVSQADKAAVVQSLKRCPEFHEKQVKLKTLAIQCAAIGKLQEIELIFSSTLEFGKLPTSHHRFDDNVVAQRAARMLKISVKDTLSGRELEKVPGFLLELLVLEVQDTQQQSPEKCEPIGDGSMQLFIATLQALCDDPDALGKQRVESQLAMSLMEVNYEPGPYQYPALPGNEDTSVPGPAGPVGYNARVLLRKHASSVLALFAASRMYSPDQGGFDNITLVELLVRNMGSHHQIPTPLGSVPSWIFGYVHPEECVFGLHCQVDGPVPESMRNHSRARCVAMVESNSQMVERFYQGPYGRYTPGAQAQKAQLQEAAATELRYPSTEPTPEAPSTAKPRAVSCKPTELSCWEDVQFKKSVVVVDHQGTGNYLDLTSAVRKMSVRHPKKPTTIIVRSGEYKQACTCNVVGLTLQIIGEGDATLIGDMSDGFLISASFPATSLALKNLTLKMHGTGQAPVHCVACSYGACVTIEQCSLKASAAAVIGRHLGSSICMSECHVTQGAAAGVLLDDDARLEGRNCTFTDNIGMAVEARGGACFEMYNCKMTGCQTQAAVVWYGGRDGLLEDCFISDCGQLRDNGAVMVTCGELRLVRCDISENRGDGVVMEASDPGLFPSLQMSKCVVRSNGQQGVALYGGSARLEDNQIRDNAVRGINIAPHMGAPPVVHLGTVRLVRNVFSGNGPGGVHSDIFVRGCDEKVMKRFTINRNESSPAMVAAAPSLSELHTLTANAALLGRKGMEEDMVLASGGVKKSYSIDTRTGLAVAKTTSAGGIGGGAAPTLKVALPLISSTREELMATSIREIKKILTDRKISTDDIHEKDEFVSRIMQRCADTVFFIDAPTAAPQQHNTQSDPPSSQSESSSGAQSAPP
eukprot:CAMPEP_0198205558 /NCGR_PEP_ID=MMETSP1445-20131203/9101_1 /TAXON_ID=36898 /ORGANISM="Pyramimonas sp., Strain CCMP2087" /LENGTH=950 /DNA_ID=CAMNT_0043877909 /DNA_START=368 /DNA_END=3216 /DNA_ORIENTATION=+